jgi:hypothetical protein
LVHRFRLAWLEEQVEGQGLTAALLERRAEAHVGVPGVVAEPVELAHGAADPEGPR